MNQNGNFSNQKTSLESPPEETASPSSLRDDLFAVITEIVGKQRALMIEDLLLIARKRTGAELLAIENVLEQMMREKIIIPGSRIIRKVVLRNPTRKLVFDLVKTSPGINYNSIKVTLQLGSNAVLWHLAVLLKFGCIAEVPYGASNIFALPEISPVEVILPKLLRNDLIRRILEALEGQELSLADLEVTVGENRRKIKYQLANLQKLGIVGLACGNPIWTCDFL